MCSLNSSIFRVLLCDPLAVIQAGQNQKYILRSMSYTVVTHTLTLPHNGMTLGEEECKDSQAVRTIPLAVFGSAGSYHKEAVTSLHKAVLGSEEKTLPYVNFSMI